MPNNTLYGTRANRWASQPLPGLSLWRPCLESPELASLEIQPATVGEIEPRRRLASWLGYGRFQFSRTAA